MIIWFANLIPILFYLLLFFVPLVLYPKTSEVFEFNKIILTYGFTVLIIASWATKMIINKKVIFRRTILDIPIIIFLTSQILATVTSIDIHTSIFGYYSRFHGGLLSWIAYSLLYWAFVSNMNRKNTIRAIYVLLFSAVMVSIYGVLQHFGIDKEVWVQDVQNRVFSSLGQPNWLAAWIVSLIPITWAFALQSKKFNLLKNVNYSYWLWLTLSALFFLVLIFTKSRSGILGFIAANAIFWLGVLAYRKIAGKVAKRLAVKTFLVVQISFLLIGLVFSTPWTPSLSELVSKKPVEKVQPIGPALEVGGGTESTKIREIVWTGALDLWKEYPILGTGVETFAYSYYLTRPQEHNLVSEWDFLYNKAHNEYLNFAATTGAVGLLAYLLLVISALYLMFKASHFGYLLSKKGNNDLIKSDSKETILNIALFTGFLSVLISNFFGFSVVPVTLTMLLFPAFAITMDKQDGYGDPIDKKGKLSANQNILFIAVISASLYLLYYLVNYWHADTLYNMGKAYNNQGEYPTARKYLTRAIEKRGNETPYYDELAESTAGVAVIFNESGSSDKAIELAQVAEFEVNQATRMAINNPNQYRLQAGIYNVLGTIGDSYLPKASQAYEDAIALAPTEAKLYYGQGLSLSRQGEIDEAIEVLEHTIAIKPNYEAARYAIALIYTDKDEKQKAIKHLKYILENITPENEIVSQTLEELLKE